MTGSGSLIGNDGRQTVSQRTNERLEQTNPEAARESIRGSIEGLLPATSTPNLLTPGEISFAQGYVVHKRGLTRQVYIDLTRTGGQGAVSAYFNVAGPNWQRATGYDIYVPAQTVSWADGDTRTKRIPIWLYAQSSWLVPGSTEADQTTEVPFTFQLFNPFGGATVFPIGRMEFIVQPNKCRNPSTGVIEDC